MTNALDDAVTEGYKLASSVGVLAARLHFISTTAHAVVKVFATSNSLTAEETTAIQSLTKALEPRVPPDAMSRRLDAITDAVLTVLNTSSDTKD